MPRLTPANGTAILGPAGQLRVPASTGVVLPLPLSGPRGGTTGVRRPRKLLIVVMIGRHSP
jgi:hypothetical protein